MVPLNVFLQVVSIYCLASVYSFLSWPSITPLVSWTHIHSWSPNSCRDLCLSVYILQFRFLKRDHNWVGCLAKIPPFSRLSVFRTDGHSCLISKIREVCGLCAIEYFVSVLGCDLLCVSYSLRYVCGSRNSFWKLWVYMILIAPENSQLAILVKESPFSYIASWSLRESLNSLEFLPIPESMSNWGWSGGGDRVLWL